MCHDLPQVVTASEAKFSVEPNNLSLEKSCAAHRHSWEQKIGKDRLYVITEPTHAPDPLMWRSGASREGTAATGASVQAVGASDASVSGMKAGAMPGADGRMPPGPAIMAESSTGTESRCTCKKCR